MIEENSIKIQNLEFLDFSSYLNERNNNIDNKAFNFVIEIIS